VTRAESSTGEAGSAEGERGTAPRRTGGVDVVGRHRRLVRRTLLIGIMTGVSRILGYVREFLSAALFGASSPAFDAFITAWRVPNLFRRLLGEGAVSTALQTTLTEVDADHGEETGRRVFWSVFALAFWILCATCALIMGLVLLMGDSMPLTGWRWLGASPSAVRELTLRLTPYLLFICLAGLASGALAVRGRFRGTSAGAVAMNLVAIGTLVWMAQRHGWSGPSPADGPPGMERHLAMTRFFSWGLVVSGVVQLVLLVPELAASGLLRRRSPSRGSDVGLPVRPAQVLRASVPLALGAAIYQVNVMIDGLMAQGLLAEGGATTYYYANRIQQLPLALVATSATSAVFPALKALAHSGDRAGFRRLHRRTQMAILSVALPATAGLVALAGPICSVLLEHGEFDASGAARTAQGLATLALALAPAGAAGLLSRTLFALGDFRTPVVVSIWMLALNVPANLVFVVGFDLDVAGLALATSLVSALNAWALLRALALRMPAQGNGTAEVRADLLKLGLASAACGGAAWLAQRALAPRWGAGIGLAAAILCGITTYVLLSGLLKAPGWSLIRERLQRARAPSNRPS
jgi:putative peptidoglycan lipid II flippase